MQLRGLVPGPHKIWLANPTLLKAIVPTGVLLGGLQPQQVEALIAGLPTSFDDPRQQLVYELASTLVQPRVVQIGLYNRAKDAIGEDGIVDVTVLMGWFTSVALTLAAFDVPANAAGLKQ